MSRLIFCLPSVDTRLHPLLERCLMPSSLLVPFRGKKTAKKTKKMKKDPRQQEMKEFVKRMELEKLTQSAALKAAKRGEPFDPELLNPARKRPPPFTSEEEEERRFLLSKEWSRYQMEKDAQRMHLLQGMVRSREKALRELEKVSSQLHFKALELKTDLFPFECKGPNETPPLSSYVPPEPED